MRYEKEYCCTGLKCLGLVPGEEVTKGSLGFGWDPVEDGGVFLVENAVPDLGGQVGSGSFCARQNHEPGYHPIQTVDGTKILLPQCLPAQVGQTAGLVGG